MPTANKDFRLIERALEWWESVGQQEPTTLTGLLELMPYELRRSCVLFKYDWSKEDFVVQEMGEQVLFFSQRQIVGMTATEAYGPSSRSTITSELEKVRAENIPSVSSVSYVGPIKSVETVAQVTVPLPMGGASTDYVLIFVEFEELTKEQGDPKPLNKTFISLSLTVLNTLFCVFVFNYLSNISVQQLRFAESTVIDSISAELSAIERSLNSVSAVIQASDFLDEELYTNIVSAVLNPPGSQRSVRAVAFTPEIGNGRPLSNFEELADRFVDPRTVTLRDWPESVPERGFPALFTWPVRSDENILGFDLWTDPARREAAQASIELGGVATSAPLVLTQDQTAGGEVSTLAVLYSPFSLTLRESDGRSLETGAWAIASGVSLGFAIQNALNEVDANVAVIVSDLGPLNGSDSAPPIPVYEEAPPEGMLDWLAKGSTQTLAFGKRNYLIETVLLPGRPAVASILAPFLFFSLGLIITGLISVSVSRASRRRVELESLVEGRTAQIKQLNKILIERSQELSSSEAAKTRLLSTLSHELRTPLNGVVGFTDLLLSTFEALTDDRRKDYLSSVAEAGGHLKSVVDRFLATTSALPLAHELKIEPTRLTDYFKWIEDLFAPQAAEHGISLELRDSTWADIVVETDRTAFTQMVTNVLDNAIKFTPAGKSIYMEWRWIGENGALVIADQGVGMSPEQIQSLEGDGLVASASPLHGSRGLGLGLSLTKSLASLLGLTLLISSTVGAGTTVKLLFSHDKWQKQS